MVGIPQDVLLVPWWVYLREAYTRVYIPLREAYTRVYIPFREAYREVYTG